MEFEAVQKLIESRSRPRGAVQAVHGVRPFTGHLFCKECGSVCYSRKSKNAKWEYHYYNCVCRQRKGPKACPNSGSIREEQKRGEQKRGRKPISEEIREREWTGVSFLFESRK